jgi:hypothetical protein
MREFVLTSVWQFVIIHSALHSIENFAGALTLGKSNLVPHIHSGLGKHGQLHIARIGVHDSPD